MWTTHKKKRRWKTVYTKQTTTTTTYVYILVPWYDRSTRYHTVLHCTALLRYHVVVQYGREMCLVMLLSVSVCRNSSCWCHKHFLSDRGYCIIVSKLLFLAFISAPEVLVVPLYWTHCDNKVDLCIEIGIYEQIKGLHIH